jgi:archaeosortase A (PGF-CTERM-specific)
MLEILILCTLIVCLLGFLLSLIPGKYGKYFAMTGWTALEVSFLLMLPGLIEEGNVLYPVLIIAAIPLIYITLKRLLKEDPHVLRLTWAAAIAGIIYAPFAIIQPLGNWLITFVVSCIQFVFDSIGYTYNMYSWDTFESMWLIPGYPVGYMDEIILGCTGITAIAILLGVIALTKTSWKQKIGLTLLVTIPIFIVNIFRNVFVIMAYFGQWFPWFEEIITHPTIPGYASYFWSHNVICEGAALILVLVIAYLLFKFTPGLIEMIREIILVYYGDLRLMFGKKPRV